MADLLPPAVLTLIVDTAEWIAGLDEAMAALADFDAAIDESIGNISGFSDGITAAMDEAGAATEEAASVISAAADEAAAAYDRMAEAAGAAATAAEESAATTTGAAEKTAGASAKMGAAGAGASIDLQKVGLAIAAVGTTSLFAAGDFQKAVTQLVTSAGESANATGLVSQGLQDMATRVGFTATELAKAMYPIESAGYHAAQGLTVMQAAAQGAKDENADLTTVANALTTVMKDYNIPVSDAADTMSKLVTAVSFGKTNLQAMSTAMANLLPVASSANLKFSDVAAVLAEMTSKGTTAQKAALDIGAAIKSLEAPTGAMIKQMGQFGITAQQVQQHLAQDGLGGTLNWLQSVAEKMAPTMGETVTGAMKKLIGTSPGLQAMLEATGGSFSDVQKAMDAVNGSMADAQGNVVGFSEVQGNLNFTFDQFKAQLENVAISIGNVMMPAAIDLFKMLDAGFQSMAQNTDIGEAFKDIVQVIGDSLKALAPVFSPLMAFFKDFVVVAGGLLVDALKILAPPLAVIFSGLDDLTRALEPLLPVLTQISDELGKTLGKMFQDLLDALKPLLPPLTDLTKSVLQVFLQVLKDLEAPLEDLVKNLAKILPAVAPVIPVLTDMVTKVLGPFLDMIAKISAKLVDGLAWAMGQVADALGNWEKGMATIGGWLLSLPKKFEDMSEGIGRFINDIPKNVGIAFAAMGQTVSRLWGQAMDFLKQKAHDSITATVATFTDLPQKIGYALGQLGGTILRMSAQAGSNLLTGMKTGAEATVKFLSVDLPNAIKGAVADAINWLVNTGHDIGIGMRNGLVSAATAIEKWFLDLPGEIKGWVHDAYNWLVNAAQDMIHGLVNTVESKLQDIVNAMVGGGGSVKSAVTHPFSGAGSWLVNAGMDIVRGIGHGIYSMFNWLMGQIGGFANSIIQGFMDALHINSPSKIMADVVGSGIVEGIADGMHSNMHHIYGAIGTVKNALTGGFGNFGVGMSYSLPAGIGGVAGANAGNVVVINNNIQGSVVTDQQVQQLVQTQTLRYANRNPTNGLALFGRGRS